MSDAFKCDRCDKTQVGKGVCIYNSAVSTKLDELLHAIIITTNWSKREELKAEFLALPNPPVYELCKDCYELFDQFMNKGGGDGL